MKDEDFKSLKVGDLIQHKAADSRALVVTGNYGDHVTAVRTVDVTNPIEWDILWKAKHERVDDHG